MTYQVEACINLKDFPPIWKAEAAAVKDMLEAGILDTYLGKSWGIKLATNAAVTVLRVDQVSLTILWVLNWNLCYNSVFRTLIQCVRVFWDHKAYKSDVGKLGLFKLSKNEELVSSGARILEYEWGCFSYQMLLFHVPLTFNWYSCLQGNLL